MDLLLCLEDIHQSSNVRQNLHLELLTRLQRVLWALREAHSGGSTCNDDCTRRKRRRLRQERDDFRDGEDQVVRAAILKNFVLVT